MIVVQWSDWIHVRREGKQIWEKNRERERERENNKHHTISKLKIFVIHNLEPFCITLNLKWISSL